MDSVSQQRASLAAFLALFGLLVGLLIWTISGFLLALFMGQLLAFLIGPLYRRIVRLFGGRERLAALAAVLLTVILALAPLAGFGTLAVREAIYVSEELSQGGPLAPRFAQQLGPFQRWAGEGSQERFRQQLQAAGHAATVKLLAWLRGLPHFGLELMMAFVALYFLLLEGDGALRLIFAPLPLQPGLVDHLIATTREAATSTVWAALAAATIQMLLLMAAMLATGVPLAFLAGGLAFIAAWVPMISSAPLWLGAALYLWTRGAVGRLAVLLAVGTASYALDHVVRPLILRGRARLHPLLGLISLLGGLLTFGLIGVFVGPVIAAVAAALYELWPEVAERSGIRPAAAAIKLSPEG